MSYVNYDGVMVEDIWGKTYLISNCPFARMDLGEDHLSSVQDVIFGRQFLYKLQPEWQQDAVFRKLYLQAMPWCQKLSSLNTPQVVQAVIDCFISGKLLVWQLTDGWSKPPAGSPGIGGLAPLAGSSTAKAAVTKAPSKTANKKAATANTNSTSTKPQTAHHESPAQPAVKHNVTADADTDPLLAQHVKAVEDYAAHYQQKLDAAIKNGDSARRIGAFKAKITEAKGELAAAQYMQDTFSQPPPPAKMAMGFGPGPGLDQVWTKCAPDGTVLEYFVVEAKGPGAKLQPTKNKGFQMDNRWVENNLQAMTKSKKYQHKNKLGQDLLDAIEDGEPPTTKLVIEAEVGNNGVIVGKSKPLPKERK
ncbi:hypothetical protein L5L78_09700 [Shewanella sp. SM34]|uniref:hypothetical protein n=1 Tax=unclassified Shewanella TaxID=196818 RepID=UPI0021DA42C3|nr:MULTISPECIES: hypothetical protein [unclassified Shewanella]MCU8056478.1 hypothetical protein [Shewanella sp. SM35]MCU8065412.1 hypothetical protein [Shewanella sp. SM34]